MADAALARAFLPKAFMEARTVISDLASSSSCGSRMESTETQNRLLHDIEQEQGENHKVTRQDLHGERKAMSNFDRNVFQIWDDRGRVVPFRVRRDRWSEHSWFVVTRIEIKKWPYGCAYGQFCGEGPEIPLNCAGCYEWEDIT